MKLKGIFIKVILLVIAVFFIISIWFGLKFKSEINKMSVSETQEIVQGIYCIKDGYVNFYIINKNNTWIMIDAGNLAKNYTLALDKLGIEKDKISAIFLTHSDKDHTGALELFKDIPIYLAKEEEKIVTGDEYRALIFKNQIDFDYSCVEDNQIINIDSIEVRCILTPGHTTGSMCFEINGKYLFTGDNFSLIDGKVELFNAFFNMDSKVQAKSIKKIAAQNGIEAIFTAHHGYSKNFNEAFNEWK